MGGSIALCHRGRIIKTWTSQNKLTNRYEAHYPGAVVDVLDDRGFEDQTMRAGIEPLRDTMITAGIAYPLVGRPNRSVDPDENIRHILRMLGDAPEHAVLKYETNDTGDAAHIGELSVVSLEAVCVNGPVLDGGVRDVSFMIEGDLPVYPSYRAPTHCSVGRYSTGASERSSAASTSVRVTSSSATSTASSWSPRRSASR